MENVRWIHMRDLSSLQKELTGLPFGIYAEDNDFLEKLYNYVNRYHRSEGKEAVLQSLQTRYTIMSNNRHGLARAYERDVSEIRVLNQLTPLMEAQEAEDGEDRLRFQLLTNDIYIDINDCTPRFKQPGQVFIVGEDNHTWIRTALRVEQQDEFEAPTAEQLPAPPPNLPESRPSMQRGAYSA